MYMYHVYVLCICKWILKCYKLLKISQFLLSLLTLFILLYFSILPSPRCAVQLRSLTERVKLKVVDVTN